MPFANIVTAAGTPVTLRPACEHGESWRWASALRRFGTVRSGVGPMHAGAAARDSGASAECPPWRRTVVAVTASLDLSADSGVPDHGGSVFGCWPHRLKPLASRAYLKRMRTRPWTTWDLSVGEMWTNRSDSNHLLRICDQCPVDMATRPNLRDGEGQGHFSFRSGYVAPRCRRRTQGSRISLPLSPPRAWSGRRRRPRRARAFRDVSSSHRQRRVGH